nr:armadillo repeat-containing protein 8-like isoform X2 [Physcomitrium patens]|eukprot:XP_024385227.1 armadillo repeat-containing protein 8-like isoform X2 [Physcomitrella patens]
MPASATWARPEDLVEGLSSLDNTARLKALRDVKNQIIGNKTKKLSYIKLGAVPRVVEILASDTDIPLLVQSAAAVGSFACGTDAGVRAVLDSGVLPHLLKMLQNGDTKVAETCARALKMIFHSPLAPKSDMFQGHRMELLLQLLNHDNESVSEVAARVLARCCETKEHQQALADAGGLQSLVNLLAGTIKIREAALDALAALTKCNEQLSEKLIKMNNGDSLASIIRLIKYKSPLTRLLACMCLANVGKACSAGYAQEAEVRASMLGILMKLLEVPGQVGQDAPGVLADLVANNEELQKTAADQNAVEKLAEFLLREEVPSKQLEGVLWGLSELCSELEESRRQLLELQVQGSLVAALVHPCEGVKVAACSCITSLSRSVKNLRTSLATEQFVRPLLQLLNDPCPAVQVEALTAVGNVVLDFTPQKLVFMQTNGVTQLINLALSMEHTLRRNAVLALKNLLFMADITMKRRVMDELTVSTLCDLIRDPEEEVQEQAVSLLRNLVHGDPGFVDQIFPDGSILFQAIEKQLINPRPQISIQALYVMNNLACGSEVHKESVLASILRSQSANDTSWLSHFLQDTSNPQLRVVAVVCINNLLDPAGDGISSRMVRLREAGVETQLRKMVDDTCLDVKLTELSASSFT